MERRSVCAAIATGGVLLPAWSAGRAATMAHRVGILDLDAENPEAASAIKEFTAELSRRGYVDAKNIAFERRSTTLFNDPVAKALVLELVRAKVDVIYVVGGTYGALIAKGATSSTPIVFHNSADPVGLGIVSSLARPGGNITGVATQYFDSMAKSLQYLAEATNRLTSFVYLKTSKEDRSSAAFQAGISAARRAGGALGINVDFVNVDSIDEFEPTLRRLSEAGVQGVDVWYYRGLTEPGEAEAVASMLIRHRLSSIGSPEKGFLMELTAPAGFEARTAAKLVHRILQGAKPADLPIEQPSVWELAFNLKTATALGLAIPKSLLLRATRVVA